MATSTNNSGNGANNVIAPFLRNVVAGVLTAQRAGEGCSNLKEGQPTDAGVAISSGPMDAHGNWGIPEDEIGQFPFWKRTLDLILILATCPIWLPLMLAVMLVVKLGSPGPVFYRQERVGYRRRLFMIFKFRSMKVNAETESHERHLANLIDDNSPMTKLDAAGDPRLIPLGRLLRAIGLDELPQIFNVICGDMSLVGPRPCLPYEFQRYEPWQQARVNAVPGLTGYWQVNGKNKTTFAEMINMDIFYSKNMSPWLDLSIMLKTIPAIIQQVLETRNRVQCEETSTQTGVNSPMISRESRAGSANV